MEEVTMTIAATQFPAPPMRSSSDPVSWRALSPSLWAARRDGRHLGTVQRGRRWLASDEDSEPIGAFRTFAEAQDAVAGSAVRRVETSRTVVGGRALVAAGLLAAALSSAAGWAWATLLL
jgi:hypothetical protein